MRPSKPLDGYGKILTLALTAIEPPRSSSLRIGYHEDFSATEGNIDWKMVLSRCDSDWNSQGPLTHDMDKRTKVPYITETTTDIIYLHVSLYISVESLTLC